MSRPPRLAYVTRVAIPSGAAQSMQIAAMATAFAHHLGERFRLVSGAGDIPDGATPACRWTRIERPRSPLPRYAAASVHAAGLAASGAVVFTRDIAIAATALAVGGRAVFEAHKQPRTLVGWRLHDPLTRCPRLHVVAISQALADWYLARWPALRGRILTAHDGVFPEAYDAVRRLDRQALRRELGLPADRLVVAHTGSIYEGRGAELFGEVAASRPDILFVQVGGSAADAARWAAHYRGLGADNVRFVERQVPEAVRRWQVAADLLFYVVTPRAEVHWCTSPLKLFEYMAAGTPILGAAIGSVREILAERNAFTYDPGQPASIRAALAAFAADPAAATQRARCAEAEVRASYDWRLRAARIIAACVDRA